MRVLTTSWLRATGCSMTMLALAVAGPAQAATPSGWVVEEDERLEVVRDYRCFGPDQAGTRTIPANVRFSGEVEAAEVFISGFNMWYADGSAHTVTQQRVDAFVDGIGIERNECRPSPDTRCPAWHARAEPRSVALELVFTLTDSTASGTTDACIGFTVLALTS